ncbi:MAG: ribosome biogenesis GTPase YlqF [Reinekea forsetii]|jgi:ribosome biogenesis GTPase A|uniref:Ribosome biogenesis GTPase A n=1 Tax=Reinekea forsetii TaxID=1336806 RepID=A0A2K8KMU9_9GAMM|nr:MULTISPECIES: ribosome biogenesis GTPase YlqF [Reinekea]ATX76157.1 50S ribosomal subunit maturation GTPase RbgA [Reinekea forsetii]MDO7641447.1 ribosome biogenesis GTPase YlqF [Reinekea forsetii]MDO7646032.1 ribosome biogenesis GTPase YlqF [Reinekea forsetii]MDO7673859.1 ribosome biogenesis GTPase YlqF [Reinekea forsetii]
MAKINWFPGHMAKARRQISEIIPKIDVVIEILDARIPHSSMNPILTKIRRDKPVLRLLSKADLADPLVTAKWQSFLAQEKDIMVVAMVMSDRKQLAKIPDFCRQMAPHRGGIAKPVRSMVVGIPNVGKSTLINGLAGKKVARVGDEPAVTRNQQRIQISNDFTLMDTPGIMWPSPESELGGYRLAASGAIRDTAVEYEDIALFAVDYLIQRYPEALIGRYKLASVPDTATACMEAIARSRACVRGREVDWHKVSEVVLKDLRSGALGQISLEEPDQEFIYRDLLDE